MVREITVEHKAVNVVLSVALALGLLPTFAFACENDYSASANSDTTTFQTDTVGNSDNSKSTESVNDSNSGDTLFIEANEAAITLANDWTQSGTCEWQIDGDGKLTIRPLNGNTTGELGYWGLAATPWYSQRESIKEVVIEQGVVAQTCSSMFERCPNLTTVNLSGLDTSAVVNMEHMFYDCPNLASLDLSSLDTSKVENMGGMFYNCTSLKTIYALSSFDTNATTASGNMFYGCKSLVGGNGTTYSLGYVDKSRAQVDGYNRAGYFTLKEGLTPQWKLCGTCEWQIDGDGKLTIRPLGNGETGTLGKWLSDKAPWYSQREFIKSVVFVEGVAAQTCFEMFFGCSSLVSVDFSGLDTSQVTDMYGLFMGCSSLESINWAEFDTSAARITALMFCGCASLPAINVSSFDTSLVTRMGGMFHNCASLKTLDLSSFDTSNVDSMTTMFYGCSSLTFLDVSSFNTAKVVDMRYMFDGCTSLTSVDLSSFDTSSVTETTGMFLDCSNLKTINTSNAFSMAKITQSDEMFANCTSLVGGAGTVYDASYTDVSRACIDGGKALPGYFTLKRQAWEGDVNSNGKLTIVDAQIAYDIAVTNLYEDWFNYSDMKKRADVDWNGTVDASDAYAIQYASLCGWKS